jgi:cation diffusion facilitator CzcD-associated flavoprotein CzcO
MTLAPGARVAIIGAGPSGLVAAKYALDAGFDVAVFEASDALGGQWHTTAPHSGIWPGMRTNTSRAMTAFSDVAPAAGVPLHPSAEQIHAYLRAYAERFGLTGRIRLHTPVRHVTRDRVVDGERFDGVIVASGRFRRPHELHGFDAFAGEVIHAFDYPGAAPYRGRRVLVYGNGISGLEIASDLATVTEVISAFRKPRYVIQKVVDGVSSDWQWYTAFGALERRLLPREELGRTMRDRVLRVAGDPAAFGAPEPDADFFAAGISLCQDYLAQVADARIICRSAIAAVDGRRVTFADGSSENADAIVCATGYDIDIPYLGDDVWNVLGPDLALYQRTLHPDLPGFGVIGQFLAQGPYFPLLELQARWIVATWSGAVAPPREAHMRATIAGPRPPLDAHNALAMTLAEELGAAPDLLARPGLTEALLFGPLLPPRYRLDGPDPLPDAAERFGAQLAASPRRPVEAADVERLREFGYGRAADLVARSLTSAAATAAGP